MFASSAFCLENECEPVAALDPAIIDDERLLKNLSKNEMQYLITGSYFKCVQTELKPSMRNVIADWMLEVCEEERCQREIFPLAMNMLDRFLAIVKVRKTQLQLLGSVCLFLATKLRQVRPIEPRALIQYTDFSISYEELIGWEQLVLSRLRWDISAVTPNDFVEPLLRKLTKFKLIAEHEDLIRRHILTMIDLCAADFSFSMLPSSMIACASIMTTIDGLLNIPPASTQQQPTTPSLRILKTLSAEVCFQLHRIAGIEKELLREAQSQIEQTIVNLPKPPASLVQATSDMIERDLNGNPSTHADKTECCVSTKTATPEVMRFKPFHYPSSCHHPKVFQTPVTAEGSVLDF